MQVKHILREKGREIISITSDATLSEAARLLARRRIGAVLVLGEDGSLAGILSERDVVRAVSDESVAALARPVSSFMTRDLTTCSEEDTVDGLMELMTNGRFRHVPVITEGRLVGIISIGDVVKTRIEETVREAISLREYIATG
ncbi:MAG TPA: CBS domain-containing protein [Rhizomicrobium sp.]|nr:CBS domain-containing protein [Rhizomicrobium sp.]